MRSRFIMWVPKVTTVNSVVTLKEKRKMFENYFDSKYPKPIYKPMQSHILFNSHLQINYLHIFFILFATLTHTSRTNKIKRELGPD